MAVHNAYHLGKIVALRQRIGAWPPVSVGRVVTAGAVGRRPTSGCTGRRASTLFRSFERRRAAPVNLGVRPLNTWFLSSTTAISPTQLPGQKLSSSGVPCCTVMSCAVAWRQPCRISRARKMGQSRRAHRGTKHGPILAGFCTP